MFVIPWFAAEWNVILFPRWLLVLVELNVNWAVGCYKGRKWPVITEEHPHTFPKSLFYSWKGGWAYFLFSKIIELERQKSVVINIIDIDISHLQYLSIILD